MRIGVDLMSVSRFTRIAAHSRYRTILFTRTELAQAEGLAPARYAERLAGRFCAKEATCKVLGRGFGQGLRWRDIEVTSDRWGAPHVALTGGARQIAALAGVRHLALSISHQADFVVAVAAASAPPLHPSAKELVMEQNVITIEQDRIGEIARMTADIFSVSADQVAGAESFVDDLEADSLLAVELLTHLEKRYDIQIPDSEILRMVNLRGTYEVVAECAGW